MNETLEILEKYDKQIVENLEIITEKAAPKGGEEQAYLNGIKSLLQPLIQNLFAGYLSLEPLMFVWDQYAIGSDVNDYDFDLVPIICATVLMILREPLIAAKSVGKFVNYCISGNDRFFNNLQK